MNIQIIKNILVIIILTKLVCAINMWYVHVCTVCTYVCCKK